MPMLRRVIALCFVLATTSASAQTQTLEDAHLTFGGDCGATQGPDRPMQIEILAMPKGPKVVVTRRGDARAETLDVNFAHVSRRLFFTVRTREGLLEFQGHARKAGLVGLLSDDHGTTRTISLPACPSP